MLHKEQVDEFYAGALGIGPNLWSSSVYNKSSNPLLFSWDVPATVALPSGASFSRASIANVRDYQGKYWAAAVDVPRIQGARVVDAGSGALSYYATDGGGSPIDPTTISAQVESSMLNSALNSRTFASFAGDAGIAVNAVGIDGASNAAATISDASGAALQEVSLTINQTVTLASVTFFLKKTTTATTFPEFFLYTGVTNTSSLVQVNTNTGAIATRAGALLQGQVISDSDSWWRVGLWLSSVYVVSFRIRPAATNVLGNVNTALTGSIITDGFMLVYDVPFATVMTSSPIFTTTGTVTRAADSLDLSSCSGFDANNETRFTYFDGSTADSNDWNGTLTANRYRKVDVYIPGKRP